MARYNWQNKTWPQFTYSLDNADGSLLLFAEKTGYLGGMVNALPDKTQLDTAISLMLAEAVKSSAIEGEYLSRKDVLSSIKKNLGMAAGRTASKDKASEGAGQIMADVRSTFSKPLSAAMLFAWHKMLFTGSRNIKTGAWRTHAAPMQVVSGAVGKEKVHFEAPPSAQVPSEMKRFIQWFNETAPGGTKAITQAPVRAAIAHLYFESIHPFEDGNGRLGRVIAEKALSQCLGRPVLLSLSLAIEANKTAYYNALKKAQSGMNITEWIQYFIKTTLAAQDYAGKLISFTLKKVKFFEHYNAILNERQLKIINRMMDEGPDGFEGGMNARKYVSLTKASKATATRDLQWLLETGVFILSGNAGGRSTAYQLNL